MSALTLNTGAVVVAAYVYASLAPRRAGWWALGLALVPGAAALWVFGGDAWLWVLPVVAASAAGLWAHGRFGSGALWLAVQAAAVLGLGAFVAWAAPPEAVPPVVAALAVVVAGLAVAVEWGGGFVGRAIKPFTDALYPAPTPDGLISDRGLPKGFADGGKTIGRWERLLIFLFVLADAPTAIGFLVTAKSILRFGEIKDRDHQKEAEYILIGTLMSFGFALVASYGTRLLLGALAPSVLDALTLGS